MKDKISDFLEFVLFKFILALILVVSGIILVGSLYEYFVV
jgi:hypothetical protein